MDNNVYFRLKFERERLGLSQAVIAAQAEVALKTVGRWEKEIAIPSDKLSLLKSLGFDVLYVLLGERTEGLLSKDESLIISKYRQADHETQTKIHMLLLGGGVELLEVKPKTVIQNPVNSGDGTQYNAETQTFHRKESGFTDLPFSVAAFLCAVTAWALGWLANHVGATDKALSFDVGIPAILLWVMAIVLMVFATEKRKIMKKDKLLGGD